MRPLVPVHVPIRSESLTAKDARERALPRVDQHVSVKGGEGGEHLAAQTAVIHLLYHNVIKHTIIETQTLAWPVGSEGSGDGLTSLWPLR